MMGRHPAMKHPYVVADDVVDTLATNVVDLVFASVDAPPLILVAPDVVDNDPVVATALVVVDDDGVALGDIGLLHLRPTPCPAVGYVLVLEIDVKL